MTNNQTNIARVENLAKEHAPDETNLLLQHLSAIRADLATLREDVHYLKKNFINLRDDVDALRSRFSLTPRCGPP
jgi:hypothetical protein